jgi:DNA helicase-2/ATP-dependent DNA helicase PcrA
MSLCDNYRDKNRLENIINILKEETQVDAPQLEEGGLLTFEKMINQKQYYMVNFDLWILLSKYEIPSIIISSKEIPETRYNKNVFTMFTPQNNRDTKYVFILAPALYKRDTIKIPEYKFIMNEDKQIEISLDSLKEEEIVKESIENYYTVEEYIDSVYEKDITTKYKQKRKGIRNIEFVFEDEAQDSSPLQTDLLEKLASQEFGDNLDKSALNLIRVGDPNQAINSTFTPADPIYFREFCEDCQTKDRLAEMDQAGRSTQIIIDAANFALEWVNNQDFAKTNRRQPPFRIQKIQPVNQENGNPEPVGQGLELYTPRDIHHTVELLSQRAIELFTENPQACAAILVRENRQGRWLAAALEPICKEHKIKLYDVGEKERRSHVPQEILSLLQFCERPHSPDYLKATLDVLVERQLIPTQDINTLASLPEEFLYPSLLSAPQIEIVQKVAHLCRSLLRAYLELPFYQIISFFALTLKYDQAELATADKLAERVNLQIFGNSSMGAMILALSEIVSSERFESVEPENVEAQYTKAGQLTIITMHKAKGLDWDYVFLPFLHENLIPGRFWIPPQGQFLGDFTLSEVVRAQIRAGLHKKPIPDIPQAWEESKYLKIAEEYRLLYVAMTRAKKLLWMSAAQKAPFTWSKPENLQTSAPCPVFAALKRQFPR